MTGAISAAYASSWLADIKSSISHKLTTVTHQPHFTNDQMTDFKKVQTLIQRKKYLAADMLLDQLIDSFQSAN